jgi:hypothetical protein
MSRENWLTGLGAVCIMLSFAQPPALANEAVEITPVAQYQATPTPMVIPMQQPYCNQRPRCGAGVYCWNGSWGPGYYLALPKLHFHRTRCIRPD